MKTYKFKVEVPEVKNGKSSLLDSFIDEAIDEQRQLNITYKINRKTTEVHRQILIDFVTEVNKELSSIGFNEFKNIKDSSLGNNHYYCSEAKLHNSRTPYKLKIVGINEREFKDSKYTTYTGKYNIILVYGSSYNEARVKTVDDVLTKMKDKIIEHIKKTEEFIAS